MAMTRSFDKFNLQVTLLAGTTAATDITVTGIATEDQIVWCGHLSTAAAIATLADITSEVSITAAATIQLSTTDTSSDQLMLIWVDRSL